MLRSYSLKLAAVLVLNLGVVLSQANAHADDSCENGYAAGIEYISQGAQVEVMNAIEEDRAFDRNEIAASSGDTQYCCTRICGPKEGQFCRYIPADEVCNPGAYRCK